MNCKKIQKKHQFFTKMRILGFSACHGTMIAARDA